MEEPLDDLVARASIVFSNWNDRLPTGAGGLSRGDLRRLERAGYVTKQLMKVEKTGVLINVWYWAGKGD